MFLNLVFKSFQAFTYLFSETELIYLIGLAFFVLAFTLIYKLFWYDGE